MALKNPNEGGEEKKKKKNMGKSTSAMQGYRSTH